MQSQTDGNLPVRVLLYHDTLVLRHDLPLCSLVLLADNTPGWRPDRAVLAAPSTRLPLEYGVGKLLDLDPGPPRVGEPV